MFKPFRELLSITAVGLRIFGVFLISLSEIVPANVSIKIPRYLEESTKWVNEAKEAHIKHFANLRIINKEHSELSDCRAVVDFPEPVSEILEIILSGARQKNLVWKNDRDEKTSKTVSINAHGGEKILRVYEIETTTILSDKSPSKPALKYSYFCFWDTMGGVVMMSPTEFRFKVYITIHGKLNNKDVKTSRRLFYVDIKPNSSGVEITEKKWWMRETQKSPV